MTICIVAAGETTRRTTVAVLSGRRRGRPLQSKRLIAAEKASPLANLSLQKPSRPAPLPSRWVWARGGTTSSEKGVSSRPPQLHPPTYILNPLLSRSRRLLNSLQWPPPGRGPGLKSLSPNPQQPLNGLLGNLRRLPRVSNPQQPKLHSQTWWSPPKIPPPHLKKSQISSTTFPSQHAWSWLIGSSRPSPPSPQEQLVRGLS